MRTVVFGDPTNGVRSLVAEALFNALAPSGWRATSGGTAPARGVSRAAATVLRDVGLVYLPPAPRTLADAVPPDAWRVVWVAAEGAPPALAGVPVVAWPLADPAGHGLAAYRAVRDEIRRRVERLIEALPRA